MDECELKPCPFFNEIEADIPVTAEILMQYYCLEEKFRCARYMVYNNLGSDKVPLDLFPNEIDKAKRLMKSSELKGHII